MSTLYTAQGGSATTSDLYTADPATAATTSVGPIAFALTGMAVDPTDGTLYGITSVNSAANPKSVIRIDKVTGAGTLVAALSGADARLPVTDITFDATGQMFGFQQQGKLVKINKLTGVITLVGISAAGTQGGALAFNLAGTILYLLNRGGFATVDPTDGSSTDINPGVDNFDAAAVGPGDILYAIDQAFTPYHLTTVAVVDGTTTDIGALLTNADALAWDITGGGGGVTADFVGVPLSGHAPLAVAFTDLSTGGPTAWAWDFGDGDTSSDQNPVHTYLSAGDYDVTLTAT